MSKHIYFGEKVKGYKVRVLNEREVRAGAGILFFFAIIAFLNSWLLGNFYYTKIFVIAFLIDFSIRLFINPKYSPSLIFGRFVVSNQEVEYVGASQKRFAWGIGFILALMMFYLLVLNYVMGPTNLFVCLTCLFLLFFESAFGICIGCKIYNMFNAKKAELCPGGTCKISKKEEIQKINFLQIAIIVIFMAAILFINSGIMARSQSLTEVIRQNSSIGKNTGNITINDPCEVPDWAVKIRHADMWKLHHGCK